MTRSLRVLVTGGLGFIGSHTVSVLVNRPSVAQVAIVDTYSNSRETVWSSLIALAGADFDRLRLSNADIRDEKLSEILRSEGCDAFDVCIHFAALKSVDGSIRDPLLYYDNNVSGTLNLVRCLSDLSCKNIIFSSSCTVYGSQPSPITEESQIGVGITNPYGVSKFVCERILKDLAVACPDTIVTSLRYFNPIGSHPSGKIGEEPLGTPANLFPYVLDVLHGKLSSLTVHGRDYATPDGTCIRDYVHVMDIADGHVAAMEHSLSRAHNHSVYNLGTGEGTSVLEMIDAAERTSGKKLNWTFGPRREGDLVKIYADADKAARELGWTPKRTIEDAFRDALAFYEQENVRLLH